MQAEAPHHLSVPARAVPTHQHNGVQFIIIIILHGVCGIKGADLCVCL